MRTSTGTIATACALSAALLVAGCGGDGGKDTKSSGEVFLQPVAAQGPDPFTDSTATAASTPSRVTRTPQSTPAQSTPARSTPAYSAPTRTAATPTGPLRAVSGATPGLYGGTARTGSCDVERQISYLTADQAKARAFARAEGISPGGIPGYLRGLTSVVLRADTQVTNHGFRDARVTGFQSVLQAGTAVLVDNRGVPRVRCACGNPLKAGEAGRGSVGSGGASAGGRAWSGFRPAEVVVVTPAPQVITNITIINIVDNTWIERPLGHRGPHHDHVVPRPPHVLPTPTPTPSHTGPSPRPHDSGSSVSPGTGTSPSQSPSDSASSSPSVGASDSPSDIPSDSASASRSPGDGTSPSPRDESVSPGDSSTAPDCTTPTVTVTPGVPGDAPASPGAADCPAATVTATPTTSSPGTTLTPSQRSSAPGAGTVVPEASQGQDSADEIGPPSVPETPDLPDGGGLIPDDTTTGSIFDSPTSVVDG
ncbi:hypothetical protein OHT77_06025 [Streptomyces sp. NBC_00252]|uniref:DUF6777 domain-containing protein n=1 Tax=Streptomyces sp. NBC_00252 TaxID=2975691 RepID=UPI002E286429|nr:DUF6777 domain-containing protein [Streptomyces sp. NBC_00252]